MRTWRTIAKTWIPPGIISLAQGGLDYVRPASWEYASRGWETELDTQGWNSESIIEAQKKRWPAYAAQLLGSGTLTVNHEDPAVNSGRLRDHNTNITYAYALALAARHKTSVKLLDWGGGLGQYCLLSEALLPDTKIDYWCWDLPPLCQAGREVLPRGQFSEKAESLWQKQYDLVLASSSLWYEQDWRGVLDQLIRVADPYLFVTRMVFVDRSPSFVVMQRPWASGYRTEYLCWIFNRREFIEHICSRAMA